MTTICPYCKNEMPVSDNAEGNPRKCKYCLKEFTVKIYPECPMCAELILDSASSTCKSCEYQLNAKEKEEASDFTSYCPKCIQENSVTGGKAGKKIKCEGCGHAFIATPEKLCSECACIIRYEAIVCKHCRAKLTLNETNYIPESSSIKQEKIIVPTYICINGGLNMICPVCGNSDVKNNTEFRYASFSILHAYPRECKTCGTVWQPPKPGRMVLFMLIIFGAYLLLMGITSLIFIKDFPLLGKYPLWLKAVLSCIFIIFGYNTINNARKANSRLPDEIVILKLGK